MIDDNKVLQLLSALEQALDNVDLSQDQIEMPDPSAFASQEPFCVDTMTAPQWLKWVFIPRMTTTINNKLPLPTRFALTPYFEETLPKGNEELLSLLEELDLLLNQEP